MFDRTTIAPPAVHVAPAEVHITMPPIGAVDAARLYGELQAEAEARVKDALVTRLGADNEIVAVRVEHLGNFEKNTRHVRLIFRINGVTHDITTEDTTAAIESGIYRTVAESLFQLVLNKIMSKRGPP